MFQKPCFNGEWKSTVQQFGELLLLLHFRGLLFIFGIYVLSSWNDYSQSMEFPYPIGIHSQVYWQVGGEQHPLFVCVELKISNFEFSLCWKALRPIDGVCVFVIFRFSRAGKDILGKFFTTCRLEHPPNNSPKVYQWNPYKVEQGGFSLVSNGTCWNNYGPEKNIRSIVDLDIHWSFEGSSPIDSAQLW